MSEGNRSKVQDELNRQALVQLGKRLSAMEDKLDELETGMLSIQESAHKTDRSVNKIKLLVKQLMEMLNDKDGSS